MDATGRDYLALCDADAACAAHLGGDAVAFVQATLATLDAAPCGGRSAEEARAIRRFLLTGDYCAAIPSVLTRLARCNADDDAALTHLVSLFPTESTQNEVLLANIAASELWPDDGPTAADAIAAEADTVVSTGVGGFVAARAEDWPRYPLSPRTAVPAPTRAHAPDARRR